LKAWHLLQTGKPLVRVEIPDPVAGPGQVVVDIQAAGLCHSDISFMDGDIPGIPTHTPIVLGHEIAGVISALGEGVTGFAIGDPVGIAPVLQAGPGVGRDGGYADKTLANVDELVPVPAGVTFAQAASATDAGATAYHAISTVGEVSAGQRVGIIGLGGLGQIGARVAVLLGAEVHATDIRPQLREVATELGAASFTTETGEFTALGLDTVFDFAGMNTTQTALTAARVGGRVVQVGGGKPEATILVVDFMLRHLELRSSLGATKDDLIAVYELLASGNLNPVISTVGFDDVADGLDRLRRGESEGRTVAVRGEGT
jgi:propanol-preferring alcohol dehydrogenase